MCERHILRQTVEHPSIPLWRPRRPLGPLPSCGPYEISHASAPLSVVRSGLADGEEGIRRTYLDTLASTRLTHQPWFFYEKATPRLAVLVETLLIVIPPILELVAETAI